MAMWDHRRPSEDLVGLIATAALDPSLWTEVADAIIGEHRVPVRLFQSLRPLEGGGVSYEVHDAGTADPGVMANLTDYEALDVTSPALAGGAAKIGVDRPVFLHDWLDEDVHRASPFCQEFLRDLDAGETAAILLSGSLSSPTILSLMSPYGERLDPVVKARLETVAPLLRRSAAQYERSLAAGGAPTDLTDMLRADRTAALLLDREGRVVVANPPAEVLLAHGPITTRNGRLACLDPAQKQALEAAVLGVVRSRRGDLGEAVVGPPAGRVRVQVAPVGGRRPFADMTGSVAAVAHLIAMPQPRATRPLSVRQRECLAFLAEGLRPDEIAHRLGLSRVTIDLHLREARQKLEARSLYQAVARAVALGEISLG